MTFIRQSATNWHEEVPGARWFRADLHVHTIDDHQGGRAKVPAELACRTLDDPAFLREYARRFLRAAVEAAVDVVALTPHAVKTGSTEASSAVWAIVDCWNDESDDDGIPFRDKVYAVFPGFEPSFNTGRNGLHLLFLFDPEIGRERFMQAFTLVTGGVQPWNDHHEHNLSSRSAREAFNELDQFRSRHEHEGWGFLIIAPHIDGEKGLFQAQKSQALELFKHDAIAALEIRDSKLPGEVVRSKEDWFVDGLIKHRHSMIHGSDAYKVAVGRAPAPFELGHRVTWVKLAQPRIEALRQAFLAPDSRVAVAYRRDEEGAFVERTDGPEAVPTARPWLRKVSIEGGASFFRGSPDRGSRCAEIPFNPGLTCLIGASMTGKSTLLDGLRLHLRAELPVDDVLAAIVRRRGEGLLRGDPTIFADTPGRTVGELGERWPAVFFTQNELQSLMRADGAASIVRGLAGTSRARMEALDSQIALADGELKRVARSIGALVGERDQASQKKAEADEASRALQAFEEAGLQQLREATRLASLLEGASANAEKADATLKDVLASANGGHLAPEIEAQVDAMAALNGDAPHLAKLQQAVAGALEAAAVAIQAWRLALSNRTLVVGQIVGVRRGEMERKLVEAGLSPEQFANLKALSRKAELRDSYGQASTRASNDLELARESFATLVTERRQAIQTRREVYDEAIEAVSRQFDGRISIRRSNHELAEPLESFLRSLSQKGITQWWNGVAPRNRPSPEEIAEALKTGTLRKLGISETVAERLRETLGEAKRFELQALRSEDLYVFEQRMDDGTYKAAEDLSGGRRVSLLLTLLLEMEDPRPLVIDQPEDELDNRALWETVLPALRRLKNRRQIILVTHNANIVVNGDADLVVQFEAEVDQGRVAVSGAIEEPAVRKSIVETVDGGRDAFELRKVKYGF